MKKRMNMVMLALVMVLAFTMTAPTVNAAEEGYVHVTSTYDNSRGLKDITVQAEGMTNLYAGQFELNYNPDFGYVRSVSKGSMLEDALVSINTDQAQDGTIIVAFVSETRLPSSGEIINAEFYATATNGVESTTLSLDRTGFFDGAYQEMDTVVRDGYIKPFDGVEKKKQEVDDDKTWTVEFNTAMKASSVHEGNIYVMNTRGTKIDTEVELSADRKKVTISPVASYDSRFDYELIIAEQMVSEGGLGLKQAVKLPFGIQ